MRSDRLRLEDALEHLELVRTFAAAGREAFYTDLLVQSAILHRLALLGEACRGVSSALREAHPEAPWAQLIAFRNVLLHEYFGVDLDLVWEVVTEHTIPLEDALRAMLRSLPE